MKRIKRPSIFKDVKLRMESSVRKKSRDVMARCFCEPMMGLRNARDNGLPDQERVYAIALGAKS